MHALPFLLALLAAAVLAPVLLRALREGGHVRPNYRERALPFPFGVLALVAALLALLAAAVLAPVLLRALREGGHVRPNYRERALPFPFGVLALVAALLAL